MKKLSFFHTPFLITSNKGSESDRSVIALNIRLDKARQINNRHGLNIDASGAGNNGIKETFSA